MYLLIFLVMDEFNHYHVFLSKLSMSLFKKIFFPEMAKHIAECLEQFNTGLDKVLQARQLVSLFLLINFDLDR